MYTDFLKPFSSTQRIGWPLSRPKKNFQKNLKNSKTVKTDINGQMLITGRFNSCEPRFDLKPRRTVIFDSKQANNLHRMAIESIQMVVVHTNPMLSSRYPSFIFLIFFQPSNVWPPITRGRLENTWFNTKCGKGILFHSPLENYYVLELLNGASLSTWHIWDGNLSFKVINASFQVMKIHFRRGFKFLFCDRKDR